MEGDVATRGPSLCLALRACERHFQLARSLILGLVRSPTLQQHTVDTQGLTYLEIARGTVDADGPDLGAVVLAPSIASAIAAKKTFYNLDIHRDQMLHSPPDLHDGFWFVNGFVDE